VFLVVTGWLIDANMKGNKAYALKENGSLSKRMLEKKTGFGLGLRFREGGFALDWRL